MEELPVTISGARCLLTGYGRISRILSRLLTGLGAEVSVAARKVSDLTWARTQGCLPVEMSELCGPQARGAIEGYDVIFNTVPQMLFDRATLERVDKGTLLIDLASRPGGIDFTAAADLQLKTIWALSLPGRVAPKSAGLIIKDTILNIIKEGL